MLKKAALIFTLILVLPAMVAAYSVVYKFGAGGTASDGSNLHNKIAVTKGSASAFKTISSGMTSISFSPISTVHFTLTGVNGYKPTKILVDNVDKTSTLSALDFVRTFDLPASGVIRNVIAYFTTSGTQYVITAAHSGSGSVILQKIDGIGGKAISSTSGATMTVNANDYVRVTGVPSGSGGYVNSIATDVTGYAGNSAASSYDFKAVSAGTATVNFAVTTNIIARLSASSGAPNIGDTVILDATTSAKNVAVTYQFNSSLGSCSFTDLGTPVAGKKQFVATAAGTYVVTVTVADTATGLITSDASVTMKVAAGGAAAGTCTECHRVRNANVYADFSSSAHRVSNPSFKCIDCHVGAEVGNHPGTVVQCNNCHNDGTGGKVALAPPAPTFATDFATNCSGCHNAAGIHKTTLACEQCHGNGTTPTHAAAAQNTAASDDCVGCHATALNHPGNVVDDNTGVRAIVGEFSKRSHHITGPAPTNAQCAVCHLEGKVSGAVVVVDPTKHMVDAKIHLRNADTNADFAWDGTNHSTMDNFCFSCHDSNGALAFDPAGLNTFSGVTGFTGTATNPFGDTLTNSYDQVARTGVVDVKTAFTTTNASHHAVSGQRYTYRFSTVANATAWAARTGNKMPLGSEIAEGHSVDGGVTLSPFGSGLTYDPAGAEEGGEATLYEGGKFVSTYIPLGASLTVADNSTLHCGDCHTVGQWKAGTSTSADGSATTAAIGAHGSNNEYLLRNSLGTDALHNELTYVCFNCHKAGQEDATNTLWQEKVAEGFIADSVAPVSGSSLNPLGKYAPAWVPSWKAGWGALHPAIFAGQFTGYATAHAVSAMHIQCLADSANNIGTGVTGANGTAYSDANPRLMNSWIATGVKAYDYSPAAGATAALPASTTSTAYFGTTGGSSNAGSGNVTGIACTNCHNSGLRSGFGGIHGGNNTYTDGLGRAQTTYRFMPGMGNYRYAPPGGWDGKNTGDASLLTQHNPLYPGTPGSRNDSAVGFPGASGKPMGGCYTSGEITNQASKGYTVAAGGTNPGYSACNHHGTSAAASVTTPDNITGGMPAAFRTTYGGGTTGNPTTYEPTVREATAGGTLVTRPLKY